MACRCRAPGARSGPRYGPDDPVGCGAVGAVHPAHCSGDGVPGVHILMARGRAPVRGVRLVHVLDSHPRTPPRTCRRRAPDAPNPHADDPDAQRGRQDVPRMHTFPDPVRRGHPGDRGRGVQRLLGPRPQPPFSSGRARPPAPAPAGPPVVASMTRSARRSTSIRGGSRRSRRERHRQRAAPGRVDQGPGTGPAGRRRTRA